MNANELADKLEQKALTADAMEYGFEVDFEEAATMLRQQQAKIDALKDALRMKVILNEHAQQSIRSLAFCVTVWLQPFSCAFKSIALANRIIKLS